MNGASTYGVALRHYNECIDHASRMAPPEQRGRASATAAAATATAVASASLLAAAWANIAAIQLARCKYVSCVEAAEKAIRASAAGGAAAGAPAGGGHAKATYRAAKVCVDDV